MFLLFLTFVPVLHSDVWIPVSDQCITLILVPALLQSLFRSLSSVFVTGSAYSFSGFRPSRCLWSLLLVTVPIPVYCFWFLFLYLSLFLSIFQYLVPVPVFFFCWRCSPFSCPVRVTASHGCHSSCCSCTRFQISFQLNSSWRWIFSSRIKALLQLGLIYIIAPPWGVIKHFTTPWVVISQ